METTIKGRSEAFYVSIFVILISLGFITASFVAFFQNYNIIFLLGVCLFTWIVFVTLKGIKTEKISFTDQSIVFHSKSIEIFYNQIKTIEIARAKYFDEQSRLKNNTYLIKQIKNLKSLKSRTPGSPIYFPMWIAIKQQPYIYIVGINDDNQLFYNIDFYTKKSVLKLIHELREKEVSVEIKDKTLKL